MAKTPPQAKTQGKASAAAQPFRKKAEKRWRTEHKGQTARAADATLHELQVHQIELEMQNEELRTTQTELIGARDSYLNLYDFAPVGYLTLDVRRVIRHANLTAARLLGEERGKLLGKRIERFAVKEARDALYLHLQAVRAASASRSVNLFLRRGDGSTFHARLESAVTGPSSASEGYYRIVLTDITALYRAEVALRHSERRFRALTEKAADSVSLLDAAGTIIYENPTAQRLLGFAAEENVGRSGFEFVHQDDLPRAKQFLADVHRRPGESLEIDLRARGRDGSWRWLEVVATNHLDDPAILGIVVNSRDVTERHEALDELRRMNEALDRLVRERTAALQLLHDLSSMANRAQNFLEAVDYCLHRLTALDGWCFGHALLPAAENPGVLVCRLQCYANDAERFHSFGAATAKMSFAPGQGLPGKVLAGRAATWTQHLPAHLLPARAKLAAKLGLATAVVFPVLLGEKVVAVLEFFSDKSVPRDEGFIKVLTNVGTQLSRVVERSNFEERLLAIADETQQAIAQDLHDDLGQELTGLGLKAETLAEAIGESDPPAARLAAAVLAAVETARDKARNLARRIMPLELELGSLTGALDDLARASTAGSRTACTFCCSHAAPRFGGRVASHLYRIAQESVSNSIRHGEARNVRIKLTSEDCGTVLSVVDDGCGMPAVKGRIEGLGLRIMRYRAGLIGATLEIGPASPRGTVVRCRLAAEAENGAAER